MSEWDGPRWFATPDGGTLYALEGPDFLVEHQRIGRRYVVHRLEVKTYADRLQVSALLARLESGMLQALDAEEYARRVSNIERLEPLFGTGE